MKLLFQNNKGEQMELDARLTIPDLLKMGIDQIRLFDDTNPSDLPKGWWINIGEKIKK
jgi:hypothetical protein